MVHLPDDLIEQLDRRAAGQGVSRSQVVREAVTRLLHDEHDPAVAKAYESGYGRIPAGTPDDWGDLEALHDELASLRAHDLEGGG